MTWSVELYHILLTTETNDWVRSKISFLVGPQEPPLATVKRQILARLGHVTRHNSLSGTIHQGTLEGGRRRDLQRKCWMENTKEWTSLPVQELLTRRVSCRKDSNRISAQSFIMRPNRTRDWTERNFLESCTGHFVQKRLM